MVIRTIGKIPAARKDIVVSIFDQRTMVSNMKEVSRWENLLQGNRGKWSQRIYLPSPGC